VNLVEARAAELDAAEAAQAAKVGALQAAE
jgi:hypothetical protein